MISKQQLMLYASLPNSFSLLTRLLSILTVTALLYGCDSGDVRLSSDEDAGIATITNTEKLLEGELVQFDSTAPLVRAALPTDALSTRYFQLTDRWTGRELLTRGTDLLEHAESPAFNPDSHWSAEFVSGDYYRIRNRANGKYIHIQTLDGTVRLSDIDTGAVSSHWRFAEFGDYFIIENRWRQDQRIHVQNRDGNVQHSAIGNGNWSTQWRFDNVDDVPVRGNEHQIGQWTDTIDWPLIAIHAALTNDGRVMTYGTDAAGRQGGQFIYDLWNPEYGTGADAHSTLTNTTGTDLFCSAQVMIPGSDDMLLSGGDTRGLNNGSVNRGVVDTNIFNSSRNTLVPGAGMNYARWYPTLTTLSNGEILVQGGVDANGRAVQTPEIYSPASRTWRELTGATDGLYQGIWWYPRSWVAPNGKVFGVGGGSLYEIDVTGQGSLTRLGGVSGSNRNLTSTSVMYRPGKILQIAGGLQEAGNKEENASAEVTEYTLGSGAPQVREKASLKYPRHWANATVLPDGKVLVTGGSAAANTLKGVATAAELYDPNTDTWTTGPFAISDRLYHSVALLLPDASVLVAGGGAPGANDGKDNFLTGNLNAEIYYPPYFFDSNNQRRQLAEIAAAPEVVTFSENFKITIENSSQIRQVNLLRAGSVTHSNNMEQRFIPLTFSVSSSNQLTVKAPVNANIAPPGYYLLHVVDANGIPSKGKMISIGGASENTWYQISDRWRQRELHAEQQIDYVEYSEKSTDQQSSHWQLEDAGGNWSRLKNRVTGEYMNIEPRNGMLALSNLPDGSLSDQWRLEPYGDYYLIKNRWVTDQLIHVEYDNSYAEHADLGAGNWSTQWRLTPVQ